MESSQVSHAAVCDWLREQKDASCDGAECTIGCAAPYLSWWATCHHLHADKALTNEAVSRRDSCFKTVALGVIFD